MEKHSSGYVNIPYLFLLLLNLKAARENKKHPLKCYTHYFTFLVVMMKNTFFFKTTHGFHLLSCFFCVIKDTL